MVAVSAAGTGLDAVVDPRFGRCPYFVIVDTETMQYEAVPNTSLNAASGAGIQAAQTIAGKGVKAVLTGNIGPNAYQALSAARIQIITGVTGTVREVVTKYRKGEFKETNSPTVGGHFGIGKGRGMGRGRR
jgi:predicted Fe-Mo cluster-binding NifX family protein